MSGIHLHLLLNHVPVVGLLFTIVLFAISVARNNSEVGKLTLSLTVVLGIATAAVFLTGGPAEELAEKLPDVSESLIERHEGIAKIATALMGALGLAAGGMLFAFRRRVLPLWATATALITSLGAAGVMAVTANLGGEIRHSEIRRNVLAPLVRDDAADTQNRH